MTQDKIRNIAIVAHVDHGKTTLVDAMLRQTGTFRENEVVAERVMDSNTLERERGITILAKNTSLTYKDHFINIVDTPGHADFGGEVERSLSMVDGIILLVDAFEGCMPQTRTVLKKALELHLTPIVVINKIDRDNANAAKVLEETYDLMIDLGGDESILDAPVLYASGRDGYASKDPDKRGGDLKPLFDTILEAIPSPAGDPDAPFQMMVSNIDFNEYTGRLAIGRVTRGFIREKSPITVCRADGKTDTQKVGRLMKFSGLSRAPAETASAGEIVCLSGVSDINIGDTICAFDCPDPLPFVEIEKPVLSVMFSVNDSPFAGNDGDFVTSRHLRERLFRELESNISLTVEETDHADTFKVSGRGELHLTVLMENMRRQGYEFQVSTPTVIEKEIDGVRCEPCEILYIDVPDEYCGTVIELISRRKGEMTDMQPIPGNETRITFSITSRALVGVRSELMTATRGTSVINTVFDGYHPVKPYFGGRTRGSLVAWENGTATSYGLYNCQDRGTMFIGVGTQVYEGMIVGESNDSHEITLNVCKKKHLTAIRSTGADEALILTPPRVMNLEKSLEFIAEDELLEVTPKELRLRKRILGTENRAKAQAKLKKQ